jgi:hypothetical protein
MKFFGFRSQGQERARAKRGEPPKSSGVLETLRRSPLICADLDLTREKRWDDFFKNGPRVSDDFMNVREQPPAGKREPF